VFFGISSNVPSDAAQLENGRPRHHGEVSLVGVLFTVVDELDFHLSPQLLRKGSVDIWPLIGSPMKPTIFLGLI
jgi:hypothetical protein